MKIDGYLYRQFYHITSKSLRIIEKGVIEGEVNVHVNMNPFSTSPSHQLPITVT